VEVEEDAVGVEGKERPGHRSTVTRPARHGCRHPDAEVP
jgi:hypothetical protein